MARGAPGEKPEAKPEKAGAEGKKLPNAGKELLNVFKNLTKAKNYNVAVRIEGGLSDNPEHRVTTANVRETYAGDVFKSQARSQLMHLPTMHVFRTPDAGAIRSGVWKNLLSEPAGVKMHRLFSFPETILERATRYQAAAQWVDGEEKDAEAEASPEEGDDAGEAKAAPAAKGKTIVVGPGKGGKTVSTSLPRIIRVEAPTKEALAHFLEVENSGCFGGG